ncbi:NifU family protein [Clostridium ganghwense]|uniref:NifU family protein n=1 Tax=Clostridium ganghwense TaxID=312089 RepID=A0ABT4CR85_9CLOT|nr:NifU family protein [Clostridium ganghwense]MCY6370591.1 NifU family protein [Clostridium ganghwense]
MEKRVIETLEKVRPMLQRDGGDVKFISASEDGIVKVELQGACAGCPGAKMTLKAVSEKILKEEVPQVKEVIGV